MTESEYLRAKADGVNDVYKWLKNLYKEYREDRWCGDPPASTIMIGIEKYKKKLRHEADEKEY